MFKNYLRITLRNIRKYKAYSLVNLAGLAVGMACSILILLWVNDELSFDRYHTNAHQIYRIITKGKLADRDINLAVSPPPLAETFVQEFPEVLNAARLFRSREKVLVGYEDKSFNEERFYYADPTVFEVFTFSLIQGDSKTALLQPNSVVLTKAVAQRYFGDANPMGRTLTLNRSLDFRITGVAEDVPSNSHFHFNFLASLSTLELSRSPSWFNSSLHTYIVLRKDCSPSQLEAKFPAFIRKYLGPQVKAGMGISIDDFFALGNKFDFFLQPLTDIHLHSNLDFELEANGDARYVYIFSIIALFILLVASVNFMNLATARYSGRAREVGVRKALGSSRAQLVRQFLAESILLSFMSLVFALALVELLLPLFNGFSGKQLEVNLRSWPILPAIIVGALFIGILSGSYPAFFLSSFQPVTVLRKSFEGSARSSWLRGVLVVFQFSISIFLLIGTFVVFRQLEYIRNKNLGFDKEHVVIVHGADALGKQQEAFKQALLKSPAVAAATASNYVLGKDFDITGLKPEGSLEEGFQAINLLCCDHDFANTLHLKMAEGRFFSRDFATDSSSIVINETAARIFGFKEPVGKHLATAVKGDIQTLTVIGVVKDFHFESLHQSIRPLALRLLREGEGKYITVRMSLEDTGKTTAFIRDEWKKFAPQQPFEYAFLDDNFKEIYRAEQRAAQLFMAFSILAIFIACLGLFGLSSYTAEQRTKEIGIRKALGSSIAGVVFLLSKEFTRWVLVANVIAWPVAYYAMSRWLQSFAYRTSIGLWIFLLAAAVAFVVALLTVSYQAVRAALANPVESLRYE
jgi:putative ABC transport system permease protein